MRILCETMQFSIERGEEMIIEVTKDRKVQGEQLFKVIVDGTTVYGNLNYEELTAITIGELDRIEEEEK